MQHFATFLRSNDLEGLNERLTDEARLNAGMAGAPADLGHVLIQAASQGKVEFVDAIINNPKALAALVKSNPRHVLDAFIYSWLGKTRETGINPCADVILSNPYALEVMASTDSVKYNMSVLGKAIIHAVQRNKPERVKLLVASHHILENCMSTETGCHELVDAYCTARRMAHCECMEAILDAYAAYSATVKVQNITETKALPDPMAMLKNAVAGNAFMAEPIEAYEKTHAPTEALASPPAPPQAVGEAQTPEALLKVG